MTSTPLMIDCDTGRDDALTLWLAKRKELSLKGVVASYGNTLRKNVIENNRRVMALAGFDDVPLFVGTDRPVKNHPLYEPVVLARQQVSCNGLCNLELPLTETIAPKALTTQERVDALKAIVKKHGRLDYYVIGPSTNLAQIVTLLGDEVSSLIRRVILMAGRFDEMWDAEPSPDFNVACDPYALDTVLKSGLDLIFVPLNATWDIAMGLEEIEVLQAKDNIARFSKKLMIAHCKYFAPEPIFRFHDPTVLLVDAYQEGLEDVMLSIDADPESDDFGRLMVGEQGAKAKIFKTTEETRTQIRRDTLKALGLK